MKFVIILCAGLLAGIYGKPTRREYPMLNKEANKTMSTLSLPSNATAIRADITDNFSCDGKAYGYYADVENECQIFHVCLPVEYPDGKARNFRWSFICPDETVFSQEMFTCVREEDLSIECKESERFYELNKNFGGMMEMENESQSGSAEQASPSAQAIDSNEIQPAMVAEPSAPVESKPMVYLYKQQEEEREPAVQQVQEEEAAAVQHDEAEQQLNTVQLAADYSMAPSEIVNNQNEEILEIRNDMLNEFNAANVDSNEKHEYATMAYEPEVYQSEGIHEEPAYNQAIKVETELPIEIIDTPESDDASAVAAAMPDQLQSLHMESMMAPISGSLLADINSLTDQVKNIVELENLNYNSQVSSDTSNDDSIRLSGTTNEEDQQQQQQQYDDSSAIEKKLARRHIRKRNKNQKRHHFLFRADAN